MKELYNELLPNESLIQWIGKITEGKVLTSHIDSSAQRLSFMISLILAGLCLPSLIVNQCGISRIICDNCNIYDLHRFYNNKIPLKHNFLWHDIAEEYDIKNDLLFFELPRSICMKFNNAKLQVIKIYTSKPVSNQLEDLLNRAYRSI